MILCVRALAHMSLHPKAKVSPFLDIYPSISNTTIAVLKITLAREAKLVPEIAAIMRFGCEDADRVQFYGYEPLAL